MKNKISVFENVKIEKMGAEGFCIAKVDGKVIFVEYAAPGDIVDISIIGKKKKYLMARPIRFHHYSSLRTSPFCSHFGVCGGCKWQHINYDEQINYKREQVVEQFQRIGDFNFPSVLPTIKSEKTTAYRGKMEFSASYKRWLTKEEIDNNKPLKHQGLGLHIPRFFDKILDIQKCHLQLDLSNQIRNSIRDYCIAQNIDFYNIREHKGWLRGVMIRSTTKNQWMILVIVADDNQSNIDGLFQHLIRLFPQVTSWLYTINNKLNDALYDLEIKIYKGSSYIEEKIGQLIFQIGAKSFFQTNPTQGKVLYQTISNMANLNKQDLVYDLYTGTGSIACFIANHVEKVVGIESVPEAIEDAEKNAKENNILNVAFFVGDVKNLFSQNFINQNGKPKVVITDPPRTGMHQKVVDNLLKLEAPTIIYVSCHPATQARDLTQLCQKYEVKMVQPVDMFPHTHHIENVVKLELLINN